MKDLKALLQHEVQDLYSAENQVLEALPRMSKAVKNEKLRQRLERNLQETRQQKDRLEQVAQLMGTTPRGEVCRGMEGLIREQEKIMKEISQPEVLDAALIGATQRIDHYKIAGYGTARAYARQIGEDKVAEILGQSLKEEKSADQQLTDIATRRVNQQATS